MPPRGADAALTQKVAGVGLGLYIARRLAEAMGGNLVLTSRPGEGCTFSLHLPMLSVDSLEGVHVGSGAPPDDWPVGGPTAPAAIRSVRPS